MSALQDVIQHAREIVLLESVVATMEWDERTHMPAAGGAYRAEQMALLSGMIHERRSSPKFGEALDAASAEVSELPRHHDDAATVRVLKRDYDKATKLPQRLVEELAKNSIEGQQAWVESRKASDFSILQPFLEQSVRLKREEAQALEHGDCLYDALLDCYEPHERTDRVRKTFSSLRKELVGLLEAVAGSRNEPAVEVLSRAYPVEQQQAFGRHAAKQIGFRFDQGRLDTTKHPFCESLGPNDVRLTTRYDERFFPSAFFGTLHEAGHGIYEQGLRKEHFGLPPGKYCSMAIHESQSRLWENFVGRSEAFWEHFFPKAKEAFPEALRDTNASNFFAAINRVKPSLIRVEADEVTYNLHIIIRFELEQALIEGELQVADLPEAWNTKYSESLGITPPDDGDGVLQDIHWSAAAIGYFPTYALGNLYAAQFFAQASHELGDLDDLFRGGDFRPLLEWLTKKIYSRGQCYTAAELVKEVTKQELSEQPLVEHLRAKLQRVYGF